MKRFLGATVAAQPAMILTTCRSEEIFYSSVNHVTHIGRFIELFYRVSAGGRSIAPQLARPCGNARSDQAQGLVNWPDQFATRKDRIRVSHPRE
jgi:hypothetical protein